MAHKLREVRVEEYAYYVNKLRQNVGLETWIWRHKERTPNTNDHHMPLIETPLMKIFCARHCSRPWPILPMRKSVTGRQQVTCGTLQWLSKKVWQEDPVPLQQVCQADVHSLPVLYPICGDCLWTYVVLLVQNVFVYIIVGTNERLPALAKFGEINE